jgi:alginate O-acetyltransferase complex protein AlgI
VLFHTWAFFFFFAVAYLVYLPLRRTKFWLHWLLATSYFFYGWWNWYYLLLITYSTVVNFYSVVLMRRTSKRKLWLWVGIINSLSILVFFKYAGFAVENLNALIGAMGAEWVMPNPGKAGILLPVGVSFYTFQSMSYTIDYYRNELKEEPSLIRFATFVSLFPQLVAGPIERAGNLLPQLHDAPKITKEGITDGMSLFLVGLFKKLALADYLATYVETVYAAPDEVTGALALILATLAFGWQIYFDFSGYTDMARGVAKMMGFNLMLNFNNPYLADGLGDFWRRWHISLSTWFKDYVYIPLGGNRGGKYRTYGNMIATMVISGIWHGAAWGFIIWGAVHAVGRVLTRELERTKIYAEKVPRIFKQLFVYLFVNFAWIFFRAESIADAGHVIKGIFTGAWYEEGEWINPGFPILMGILILGVWVYQYIHESRISKVLAWAPMRIALAVAMILYMCFCAGGSASDFIYFQF